GGARRPGTEQPGRGPGDVPPAVLVDVGQGAVHLEVVVLLGVELGDRSRVPDLAQVADGSARGLARVVPALEGGDQDGVAQRRYGRQLAHGSSLRRPAPPQTAYGAPAAAKPSLRPERIDFIR